MFLKRKGMKIHLGGIGKGYAVERALSILRKAGLRDFMIQAGGDLYVGGHKDGRPGASASTIRAGRREQSFATIDLTDSTFSTSGDYARFFMKDGVRYHHILDPSTGQPARLCRSVTIAAESPVLADAVAKGVFILGPEKGMALVERIPNLEAVIVTAKNEVLVSSGLKDRFVLLHAADGRTVVVRRSGRRSSCVRCVGPAKAGHYRRSAAAVSSDVSASRGWPRTGARSGAQAI